MQNGRVVTPAKTSSNIGQRAAGELAREKHGDLPWTRDLARAVCRMHFTRIELVEFRRLLLDFFDGGAALPCCGTRTDSFLGNLCRHAACP